MDSDLNQKNISIQDLFEKDLHFGKQKSGLQKAPKIWVVASGKGGVGKTFVTTSLGLTLSKLGSRVVVIDLDISGANVHTALGYNPQESGLKQFFDGTAKLENCLTQTKYPRLSFIQGVWNSWSNTDLTEEQVSSVLNESKKLPCDYVVIDLGAGTLQSHLKTFLFADEKFLVTSPEPTSLEKNYRFIEAYLCEDLKQFCNPSDYQELLKSLRERRSGKTNQLFSFRSFIESHGNIQLDYFRLFEIAPVRLVVNACRSEANLQLGDSISSVCRKFFNLKIEATMSLEFDNAVWQSVKNREPVLQAHPFSPLAGQFLTTCKELIGPQQLQKVS